MKKHSFLSEANKYFRYLLLTVTGLLAQHVMAQTAGAAGKIVLSIAPNYDSVGSFHRFWLGNGYRHLWAAPVELDVMHLASEKGGLTPVDVGGGFQTKSLRLRDANGRMWVLRSVQKYPERKLPQNLRNTIAQRILQDQVVTVHPFGALTVAPLAEALGLAHTNPRIVYLPDDPGLATFRADFANAVLLFEERGAIDTFRTINTETLQHELQTDSRTRVNQRMVLRARLLDFLLGDWDRHEGQWRWEAKPQAGYTLFNPVPHDRDYVFYSTSGVLPWLVAQQYMNARFQKFGHHIRNIEIYNYNNRYFDRYFLNALSAEDWEEEIESVQKTLSDDVLHNAVKRLPDTVYALSGPHLLQTLIERRKNLKADALEYYRFLSGTVDLPATDEPEVFHIFYKPGGSVQLTITTQGERGNEGTERFRRTFDPSVTKEIRLYGLGGNDRFEVDGTDESPIRVRMIGGGGNDSFVVAATNPNNRKLLVYDRQDEGNAFAGKMRLRLGHDSTVNSFDRHNFRYNITRPFFSLFYNIDQRAMTSIGVTFEKQGFRKYPYASRHQVVAGYSASRGSFAFAYEGDWRQVFGQNALNFRLVSVGPKNLQNFFGTGNETTFPHNSDNGKNIQFFRNRVDIVYADLRLKRYMTQHVAWSAGLAAQYYSSSAANNAGRFLSDYAASHPQEQVFLNRVFGGIGAGLEVDTRRSTVLPARGIWFHSDGRAMTQLRSESRTFGALQADLSVYTPFGRDSGIVLMNRVGGGVTGGDPVFYQMMQLGGQRNLRGFNTARFTGRSMLFHNAELRVKLFQFTSYLFPGQFGLIAFNDVGRVWMPRENSSVWHDGYGGGVYLFPANVVLIRATVGHSNETTQFYFNLLFGL